MPLRHMGAIGSRLGRGRLTVWRVLRACLARAIVTK